GVRVGRRPLEDGGHLVGGERGLDGEQHRRGGGHLGRGEGGALGRAVLLGAAARVALLRAPRVLGGELPRQRGQDRLARSGDVVEDRVAVREGRRRAVLGERA